MKDTNMDCENLRKEVSVACRALGLQGVTRGPVGHVSVLLPDGSGDLLIKGRGVEEEGLGFVSERDILRIDRAGRLVKGAPGLKPPAETALHLALYEASPDVRSVVHVHPEWIVALSAAGLELLPIVGAYDPQALRLVEEGIAEFSSAVSVHDLSIGREVAKGMGTAKACVMRGHGIVVVGGDLDEALRRTFALHELGRINWLAAAVGTRRPISEVDRQTFCERKASGQSKEKERRSDGHTAFWHYVERCVSQRSEDQ